jgi:hypothetical protein
VIEKLHEEIKKSEADRQRLAKYKASKADRLEELEEKVKSIEIYSQVDTGKLVGVLVKQDKEASTLRATAKNANNLIA